MEEKQRRKEEERRKREEEAWLEDERVAVEQARLQAEYQREQEKVARKEVGGAVGWTEVGQCDALDVWSALVPCAGGGSAAPRTAPAEDI